MKCNPNAKADNINCIKRLSLYQNFFVARLLTEQNTLLKMITFKYNIKKIKKIMIIFEIQIKSD